MQTIPDWVQWLISISNTWTYTALRIVCFSAGVVGFVWSFVAYFRGRPSYAVIFLVGFGSAMFGWGWPMMTAMHYGLSECQMDALLLGKIVKPTCDSRPGSV